MELLAIAVWILIGAAIAIPMVRRGHSPVLWWVLTFFGPLAGIIALVSRHEEGESETVEVRRGWTGPGDLDVLIGVAGTEACLDACRSVVHLLRGQIGTLTVATTIGYDTDSTSEEVQRLDAEQALTAARRAIVEHGGPEPDAVVLVGSAADQLDAWARDHHTDLIAVASRSHSAVSHLFLGSVARGLTTGSACPVLVVPPRPSHRTPSGRARATASRS